MLFSAIDFIHCQKYQSSCGKRIAMRTLLFTILLLTSGSVMGTHLLGGYISYRQFQGGQVEVTVNLLIDVAGVSPGSGTLTFGDGQELVGLSEPSVKSLGDGVNLLSYSVLHSYGSTGTYKISYIESNYTEGIINISDNLPFYISSCLTIDPSIQRNDSPVLQFFSFEQGISGHQQNINPAPIDADNDSLSFKLIVPGGENNSRISSYLYPNDSAFYNDYATGNQSGDGLPLYSINGASGDITWDAPELLGVYVIAYEITQWRKDSETWRNIGFTEVVMMNFISDEDVTLSVDSLAGQCVENEDQVQAQIILTNSSEEPLTVKVASNLDGVRINGTLMNQGDPLELTFSGELNLNISLSEGTLLEEYALNRVFIQVASESLLHSFSWVFSKGCVQLPGEILPEPIAPVEPEEGFLVFPNPTNLDYIDVRLPENKEQLREVCIFNLKGQVLLSRKKYFTEKILRFALEGLTPGVYIVKVDDDVQKFIVMR